MTKKPKQPKRIKRYANESANGWAGTYPSAMEARDAVRGENATRVAVPLIELRSGEVVVDVEALVGAFARQGFSEVSQDGLRDALKKVGVR